jgi:PTS system ascorbate-specific IIA component
MSSAVLVVAHAPLASSLAAVATHVFPECLGAGDLTVLDVDPGLSGDDVVKMIDAAIRSLGEREVLVLTDVQGATPCNAARQAVDGVRSRVLAGVNVPMLWRALCYRGRPLAELEPLAMEGGTRGVMHVPREQAPQNQSSSIARHDQVEHRHQQ